MFRYVGVVTLGCSKNTVDSEFFIRQLELNGFKAEYQQPFIKAQVIVINTCGFILDAKEESIETILSFIKEKQKHRVKKVIVVGCLVERYKKELKKELKEVDAFFGVAEYDKLLKYLGSIYQPKHHNERTLTTPKHYAYLKIAEGCNRRCSFCAIPAIRGKYHSIPIESLVKQAKLLVAEGVKELNVIAQDTTYYGVDIYKKPRLADLLKALSDVKGIEWIRLHYAYPTNFPLDVLDVMKKRNNICKYLDMPFQHISTKVLKAMQRGINKKATLLLIEKIKNKIPNITLRTTMLVGFPGEGAKEFNELKEFVKDVAFDRLGVFAYSPEEGTSAYKLKDNISFKEKQKRLEVIMQIQEDISYQKNQEKVGKVLRVLFDREEGGYYIGRTESDSPEVDNEVLVKKTSKKIKIGSFQKIKIISADSFDLFGKFLKN